MRDIATLNHGGSTELLIATTGRHGIYRCGSTGWEPVFKDACNVLEIEADSTPGNTGVVWAIINGRLYTATERMIPGMSPAGRSEQERHSGRHPLRSS